MKLTNLKANTWCYLCALFAFFCLHCFTSTAVAQAPKLSSLVVDSGHPERIGKLEVSRDGKFLLSADYSGKVIIRDFKSGTPVAELSFDEGGLSMGGRLMGVKLAFSPDSRWLAAGFTNGELGEVVLYSTSNFKPVARTTVHGRDTKDPRGISALTFTPNGQLVTVSVADKERTDSKGLARIWRISPQGLVAGDATQLPRFTTSDKYQVRILGESDRLPDAVKPAKAACMRRDGSAYAANDNGVAIIDKAGTSTQVLRFNLKDHGVSMWCTETVDGFWLLRWNRHENDIKKPGGTVWLSDKSLFRWQAGETAPTLVEKIGAQNFSEAITVPGGSDLLIAYGKGVYGYSMSGRGPTAAYAISDGSIRRLFQTVDGRSLVVQPQYSYFLGGEYIPETYLSSVRMMDIASGRQTYAGTAADCFLWAGAVQECSPFNGGYTYTVKGVRALPTLENVVLPEAAARAGVKLENIVEWSLDRKRWMAQVEEGIGNTKKTRILLGDVRQAGVLELAYPLPDRRSVEGVQQAGLIWPQLDYAAIFLKADGNAPFNASEVTQAIIYELGTDKLAGKWFELGPAKVVGRWNIPKGASDQVLEVDAAGARVLTLRTNEEADTRELIVRDKTARVIATITPPADVEWLRVPRIAADGLSVWIVAATEGGAKVYRYALNDPKKPWSVTIATAGWPTTLLPLADGKFAVGTRDGAVHLLQKDGRETARFFVFPDGGWLTMLPSGYFVSSSVDVEKRIYHRHAEGKLTALKDLREKFFRPDLVQMALAGGATPAGPSLATIKLAPQVEIAVPSREVTDDKMSVEVVLSERGGGVGDVRMLINGVAISNVQVRGLTRTDAPGTTRRSVPVRLVNGRNEIKVLAFNADNSISSESDAVIVQAKLSAKRPQLHALIIGINEFVNPKLKLRNAVNDATAMSSMLKLRASGLFESVNVRLLSKPAETTKSAILSALESYASIAPEDVFLFYVASHGSVEGSDPTSREYFLYPSNVGSLSAEAIKRDAISQQELKRLIGNIAGTKRVILLDTCHSGALADALVGARGVAEDAAIKVLSYAVGSTIISAAGSQEEALEDYQGHGIFTWSVLQALGGKADRSSKGFVTTTDLAAYVEDEVPRIAELVFRRKQFPTMQRSGNAFPITQPAGKP
jgi:WD40 repeat protein